MAGVHPVRALLNRRNVARDGRFTNVIFPHHSIGRNLIYQGGVRERLTADGFQFWDRGNNWEGLIHPAGARAGYS